MQIRNPWSGGEEWDGDWRDDDPRWNQGFLIVVFFNVYLVFLILVPASIKDDMGWRIEEDGTWWMSFHDFCVMYTGFFFDLS